MFTSACKKITGNGLVAGCQLFYCKICGYFYSVVPYIFVHKLILYDSLLELSCRDGFIEVSQHMFHMRNKKTYPKILPVAPFLSI